MKESTGQEATDSQHAKALLTGEGKIGKTVFTIGSLLGLFPWQEEGGVVDKPSHLHVIGIDYGAITGAKVSLKKMLNAPDEAFSFRYYSLQDDYRSCFGRDADWDFTFYNQCLGAVRAIEVNVAKAPGGVHAVLVSSLTTLQAGLERGVAGPPGGKSGTQKGAGMDMAKWQAVYGQVNEFRNYAQADRWHCLWEAHIDKVEKTTQTETRTEESLQIRGKAGRDFANNVEQIFRIKRNFGMTVPGTKLDLMYLDTRPAMDFIAGGRGTTENLKAQEPDMAKAFRKLGLRVGNWKPGKKKKPEAA